MAKVKKIDVRGTRSGRLWLNMSIRFCHWRERSAERKAERSLYHEWGSASYWMQVERWWRERAEELEDIRVDLDQNHSELLMKGENAPLSL